jgi:hypothetical protein
MRYTIVKESDTNKLSETVKTQLDAGWELQGGPICFEQDRVIVFAQAVTHEEDEPVKVPIVDDDTVKRLSQILDEPDAPLSQQELKRVADQTYQMLSEAMLAARAAKKHEESE